MYANVSRMYDAVVSKFNRYLGHVSANIGGHYITNHSIEQPDIVKYAPVPKAKQKAALDFLNQQLFTKPTWLVDVPYIFELTDQPDNNLYTLVNNVVSSSNLLSVAKLNRLAQFAEYDPSNYKPEEYLSDLTGMVFSELDKGRAVDSYRRYLQRRFVTAALEVVNSSNAATSDARTMLLATLMDLQKKASKAKSSDSLTKAHWQALAKQIGDALKVD